MRYIVLSISLFSVLPQSVETGHKNVGILTLFSELKGGLNPTPFHALMCNTSLSLMMSTESVASIKVRAKPHCSSYISLQVVLHAVVLATCGFLAGLFKGYDTIFFLLLNDHLLNLL